jgi:threonine synthase
MYRLVDYVTKQPVKTENLLFTGENSPWEIQMDIKKMRDTINIDYFKTIPSSMWKYLPLLPINNPAEFVTLREMPTPLVKSKLLGKAFNLDLYFKVEGKNPTGSFKDRGSSVEISVAKEYEAKSVILASTGNMAASCACYAARAKIPCYVIIPETTPIAKLAQVMAFGGTIIPIQGDYNLAADFAKKMALEQGFYLAGDYAFRLEGQKTAAFELIEQLNYQVPDIVIVPVGCGTNIAAYAKGFREYYELGLIDKLPQLVAVQAEHAASVVKSYNRREKTVTPLSHATTVASAIAVTDPVDGLKALDALYSTQGYAISVSDEDILRMQYFLSQEEGWFVESAAATTIAALSQLVENYDCQGKKIVCILTGDGLKDPQNILNATTLPAAISANEADFYQLLSTIKQGPNYAK